MRFHFRSIQFLQTLFRVWNLIPSTSYLYSENGHIQAGATMIALLHIDHLVVHSERFHQNDNFLILKKRSVTLERGIKGLGGESINVGNDVVGCINRFNR